MRRNHPNSVFRLTRCSLSSKLLLYFSEVSPARREIVLVSVAGIGDLKKTEPSGMTGIVHAIALLTALLE